MTPWLLLDYGDVISRPYDESALVEISGLLDLDPDVLHERYWADRPAFDAGSDAADYWSAVAGRPMNGEDVERLVRIDCAGWARVDPAMLGLVDEQARHGTRLALLSNAPHFQADAFDELAWTDRFEHVFVSARLGLIKPDPALFQHVLIELDAQPDEVTFVDDRPANTAAAAALGIRTVTFTTVEALRAALA